MNPVNLSNLQLLDGWFENDPSIRQRAAFPFYKATGTTSSSVVYFELNPGESLGTHTDSAEEVIIILNGMAEVTLGDEIGELNQNEMALVPTMVPHNLRNIGTDTLKVVGFFSSESVVSTFVEPVMPINQKAVGTPPIESETPLTWNEILQKMMGLNPSGR